MNEKMEVSLKEEDKKLLQSLIEKLSQPIPQPTVQEPKIEPKIEEKHEEKKGHATLEEQIACPDCYSKIEALIMPKLKPKILKEVVDKAHGRYHCKGCGLKVEENQENCPLCGGTKTE